MTLLELLELQKHTQVFNWSKRDNRFVSIRAQRIRVFRQPLCPNSELLALVRQNNCSHLYTLKFHLHVVKCCTAEAGCR